MNINKKFLQFIGTILVLVFHIWATITSSTIESFIVRTSFIGVDLFFFVSAYSLADKKIDLKSFMKNRFQTIYLKFAVLTLIAFFYKKWKIKKLLLTLTGMDLFISGGGSFLWFVPAIMIFYFLYPLFVKWKNPKKELIVLSGYTVLCLLITYLTKNRVLFIFLNRLPVVMAAYYLKTRKININKFVSFLLVAIGIVLLYFFFFKKRLNVPFAQFYYIMIIPFVIGFAYLTKDIKENKVVSLIGNCSLEVYGLSMIFGFNIAAKLLKLTNSALVSNIISITSIIVMSIIFKYLYDNIFNLVIKNS